MEEAIRISAASPAPGQADLKSPPRFEHALELLLTHRGNPAAEIDRLLADDPNNVVGHCLRAAVIVCADAVAVRSSLAQSVAAIEAACPDPQHPVRGPTGRRDRHLRRHERVPVAVSTDPGPRDHRCDRRQRPQAASHLEKTQERRPGPD